jgi:hypothetical protein
MRRRIFALALACAMLVAPAPAFAQAKKCVEEGKLRVVQEGRHPHPIESLALSRDARRLLSAERGELTLWDVSDGRRAMEVWLHPVVDQPTGRLHLAFGPGEAIGTFFVAGTRGGWSFVRRYDYDALAVRCAIEETRYDPAGFELREFEEVGGIAVSPDGRLLAVGGLSAGAARIRLMDTTSGAALVTIGLPEYLRAPLVAFAMEDGQARIVAAEQSVGGPSGPVLVWNAQGQRLASLTPELVLKGDEKRQGVSALAAAIDGTIIVGYADGNIALWRRDAAAPGRYSQPVSERSGHSILAVGTWDAKDAGRRAAFALSEAGELRAWADGVPAGPPSSIASRERGPVAFDAVRRRFVRASAAGTMAFVDAGPDAAKRAEPIVAYRPRVLGAALGVDSSEDGKLLLATYRAPDGSLVGLVIEGMTGEIRRVHVEAPAKPQADGAPAAFRFAGDSRAILSPAGKALTEDGVPAPPQGALWSPSGHASLVREPAAGAILIRRASPSQPGEARLELPRDTAIEAFDASEDVASVALLLRAQNGSRSLLHWDEKARRVATVPLGAGTPRGVAMSFDGALVLVDRNEPLFLRFTAGAPVVVPLALARGSMVAALAFAPRTRLALFALADGTAERRIASVNENGEATDLRAGPMRGTITRAVPGSQRGLVLTSGEDGAIRLWDLLEQRQAATYIASARRAVARPAGEQPQRGDFDWVVVDAAGTFNARNPTEVFGLHWAIKLSAIALGQMREEYHDPVSLGRALGLATLAPLKPRGLTSLSLPPRVFLPENIEADTEFEFELKDLAGGSVSGFAISLNGQVVFRGKVVGGKARYKVDSRLLRPGPNELVVHGLGGDDQVLGRGQGVTLRGPEAGPARLFALVAGVSHYGSAGMRLRWADQDARRFADALQRTAVARFGKNRVHVELFTSRPRADRDKLPERPADKDTLLDALKAWVPESAASIKPSATDTVVLFLAGHGAEVDGRYQFLGRSADEQSLASPDRREQDLLSGEEIVHYLRRIPGSKVVIFDTCNARAFGKQDAELRQASAAFDQAFGRAIGGVRSAAGPHVLYGSWSDLRAYESAEIRHGLLSFALLHGLSGVAYGRPDVELGAQMLFRHARRKVVDLARGWKLTQAPHFDPQDDDQLLGRFDPAEWHSFERLPGPVVLTKVSLLNTGPPLRDELEPALEALLRARQDPASRYEFISGAPSAYSVSIGGTYAQQPDGKLKAEVSVSVLAPGMPRVTTWLALPQSPDEFLDAVYRGFLAQLPAPPPLPDDD